MHFTTSLAAVFLSSSALVAAQHPGYGYSSAIYARGAYDDNLGLHARWADHDDFDLYARDADYDDFDLYARGAYDDDFDLYARDAEEDDYLNYLYARAKSGSGHGPGSVVEGLLGVKNKYDEYKDSKTAQILRQNQQPSPFVKKAQPITGSSGQGKSSGEHVQDAFAKLGLVSPAKKQ
ncbi:MAG: hypothetical protein LQ340_002182 [Diploschistes diacapsis]|nr:MAG: hypothetical protein LQ340_002182 [Diploschistes diacapsis]